MHIELDHLLGNTNIDNKHFPEWLHAEPFVKKPTFSHTVSMDGLQALSTNDLGLPSTAQLTSVHMSR